MARIINDSIQNNSPKSLDQKFTKFVVDISLPYTSVDEVNNTIPSAYRSIGLTALIRDGNINKEFWYREDTTNSGLVEKITVPNISGFTGIGNSTSPLILTKDNAPIQNSTNPITSGAVYDKFVAFRNEIDLVYNQSLTPNLQDVTDGEFNNITNRPIKIGNRLDIGFNGSFIKDDDGTLDIVNSTNITMTSGNYSMDVSSTGIRVGKLSDNSLPNVSITIPTTSGILPISVNNITSNTAGNIQLSSVNGSFTTADGKVVTITNGVITALISS